MNVSLIVAMSRNRVIGRDNTLPWRLPADLARFKQLTMGHWMIMGRRTFDSIRRVLPGRTTVIVTRQPDYKAEGALVARSVPDALRMAEAAGETEAFVIGGAQIYREALPSATRMYVTAIDAEFDGDTRFPDYDESQWKLQSREDRAPDEKNEHAYSFQVYERA